MLMNSVETLVVDSPPRVWLAVMARGASPAPASARPAGAQVVEFGCGRGVGTQLWLDHLGAAQVTAVDLDPAMIFEEVSRHALQRWSCRTFREHPQAGRFSAQEFADELADHGFTLPTARITCVFEDFVLGVALKDASTGHRP